jgi:predicted O-linked N-acetylglucosamine transferase (SPINDLY family)
MSVDQLRLAARGAALMDGERLWQALLQRVPGDPEALFGLGNAASARGDSAAAASRFEMGLRGSPRHFGLLNNLGLVYEKLGRLTDAEDVFRQAMETNPSAFAAVANLAQNLYQQKRHGEASVLFDKLASHTIKEPSFNANRGVCLAYVQRFDEAEKALQLALRQAPERVLIKRDLALVRTKQGRWADAVGLLEEVHAALPDDIATVSMLEGARSQIADWHDLTLRRVLIDAVTGPEAASLPPLDPFMFLTWTDDPAVHLAAARCWTHQLKQRASEPAPTPRARAAGQPLRVGFVSSDFTNHPVNRLLLGLVERLDPDRFTLVAYSTHPHPDTPLRKRLRATMAIFREIGRLGPAQQEMQIRDDGIDILIDLNGYTSGQPHDLIARRAAPLQINYLGYTGTLGTAACDCIVTDRYSLPEAEQAFYTEAPLFIEPCYLPSDPLREQGTLLTLPGRSEYGLPSGVTVLAAFSACYKITPQVYDVWMRVLHKVPDSVLWLRSDGGVADENLREEAQRRGIGAARLVFAIKELLPRYFARFQLADLLLDTYPFGGHTTVNDALFAGVPVLTLAGRSFASRASGSQLIAAGLPELVAENIEQYESLAVALARDAGRRREIAEHLRKNRQTLRLFDMDRYARTFADALTNAWNQRFNAGAIAPAAPR